MYGEKKLMISWKEMIRTMEDGIELANQTWTDNLSSVLPPIDALLKMKELIDEYINLWADYESH